MPPRERHHGFGRAGLRHHRRVASHAEQHDAIAADLRWRNQHATPKQGFAVDSKIRLPEFLSNAA
jgi:hypothetical protein